jgi:uncharacterized membrane protein YgaE (UPF0421/DUF939 family)
MSFIFKYKKLISEFIASDRIINSLKTGVACFLGLLITEIPGFRGMSQWIVISIVVVMSSQINLGGVIKQSYVRIIGTIGGAIVAGISVLFFAHQQLILWLILLISCMFFTYIASGKGDTKRAGTLGAVTAIMILLTSPPNFQVLLWRPVEIVIGIMIALMVTIFILPIQATVRLKSNLGSALEELRNLFLIEDGLSSYDLSQAKKMEEHISSAFVEQRDLMKDSKTEHHNKIKKSTLYELMTYEHKLYRAILLAAYALKNNPNSAILIHQLPIYGEYRIKISQQLEVLVAILKNKSTDTPEIAPFSLEPLTVVLKEFSAQQPFETALYIDAFIVAMKIFSEELANLTEAIKRLYV